MIKTFGALPPPFLEDIVIVAPIPAVPRMILGGQNLLQGILQLFSYGNNFFYVQFPSQLLIFRINNLFFVVMTYFPWFIFRLNDSFSISRLNLIHFLSQCVVFRLNDSFSASMIYFPSQWFIFRLKYVWVFYNFLLCPEKRGKLNYSEDFFSMINMHVNWGF